MGTDTSRPLDAQDTERTHSAPMTYSPGRWAALEREVEKAVQESFTKHKTLCVTERMRLALMAHHIKVEEIIKNECECQQAELLKVYATQEATERDSMMMMAEHQREEGLAQLAAAQAKISELIANLNEKTQAENAMKTRLEESTMVQAELQENLEAMAGMHSIMIDQVTHLENRVEELEEEAKQLKRRDPAPTRPPQREWSSQTLESRLDSDDDSEPDSEDDDGAAVKKAPLSKLAELEGDLARSQDEARRYKALAEKAENRAKRERASVDQLREDCRVAHEEIARLSDEAREERTKKREATRLHKLSVNADLHKGVTHAATEAFLAQRTREFECEIASWAPLEDRLSGLSPSVMAESRKKKHVLLKKVHPDKAPPGFGSIYEALTKTVNGYCDRHLMPVCSQCQRAAFNENMPSPS